MRNKKVYFVTTAIWGNIIGFTSMRLIGKFHDAHPWNDNIIISGLTIFMFFSVMGMPGAYFYAEGIKESTDEFDPLEFLQQVYFNSMFAFILGIFGVILGRTL